MASRKRPRAAGDRPDFGPQQLHAEHVRLLAADVFLAHVDDALQAEAGTGRGGGHAVLAGAGLGDHALLAHAQREQRLAERVVDLVGAGVIEVFALEIDLRPAAFVAQPLGVIQRRRPADVVGQQIVQLGLKRRIDAGLCRIRPPARRGRGSAFRAHSARQTGQNGRRDRERDW